MSLKRLLPLLALALVTAAVVVSSAPAGDVADQPCPDATGPDTATCPPGTVGVPYSLTFLLKEGSGCGPVSPPIWTVTSGTFPPGLTLSSEGVASGNPTEAGNFTFYLRVHHPFVEGSCAGDFSDKQVTIPINLGTPALPKLTIGPETVGPATVGSPYSVAMTASVGDPKSWSISAGALPPGLTLGASDGVISGTPTSAGSYGFTVHAATTGSRSDAKALTIAVRNPLEIAASAPFDAGSPVRSEVGVKLDAALAATGGFGTYTWSLVGEVPPGLTFDPFAGTLTGRTTESGSYRFTVSVADSEDRVTAYAARIIVAERLAIRTLSFRSGKVGFFYSAKLRSFGGVGPVSWRVKRGPLPRGITFDRTTAKFFGTPTRSGTWTISVEVVDSLRVKSTATITITVGSRLKLRTSG